MYTNLTRLMFCLSLLCGNLSFLRRASRLASRGVPLVLYLENSPYDDVIPFLSEHVQPSDQLLFVGAKTDMCLQLARNGYGSQKTGLMTVVDGDQRALDECISKASSIPECVKMMREKKLTFVRADLESM